MGDCRGDARAFLRVPNPHGKAARAQESSRTAEFMGIEYILTRGMEYADIAHRERKCFLLAVLSAVAQDKLLDQAGG
jgi:hypothetical protein